ncbi:hypothetical protein M5M_10230 [Simiduia agarivorans SA1 = DSM 21679]|uniref:DUF2232 domain-containing protein n=2 Tax=Simiduia TaxID=447467 RepID=K4KZ89_SIMAS|nr:hypothetical protein M5M_10230 [Simiduia agarivorans SA1 = DSM 21679]
MQALLEFIMRGRLQAVTAAMIGSWFPLVSPAVVALVSLRKGAFEGALVMVGAMLPALFALVLNTQGMSDIGPAMVFVTLLSLVVVMLAAQVLRLTVSWARTLTGLVALSAAAALVLGVFLPDPVQAMTDALGDFMQQLAANAPEGAVVASPDGTFVLGLIAFVIALSGVGSLLLARWCQARLYNPGGFQQEFHSLRLTPVQAMISALAAIYCMVQPMGYQPWASLFSLPLLVAGVALIHALVQARGSGPGWLVVMYIALFVWAPLTALLAAVGLADTWLNIRGRLQAKAPSDD